MMSRDVAVAQDSKSVDRDPVARSAAGRDSGGSTTATELSPVLQTDRMAGRGAAHRSAQRMNSRNLLALQRLAGNRSVSSLVAPRSTAPRSTGLAVQRCGEGCGCCGSDSARADDAAPRELQLSREAPPGTPDGQAEPVQRGVVEDVAGAVLPDWVTDLAIRLPKQAKALGAKTKDEGTTKSTDAKASGQGAAEAAKSTSTAAAAAGAREASTRGTQATGEIGTATSSAQSTLATAGQAAAKIGAVGSQALPMLNPAGSLADVPQVTAGVQQAKSAIAAIPGGAADLASDVDSAIDEGLKQGDTEGWDCDKSEVMAIVGGVGKAITDAAVAAGKKLLGADRYAALVKWVNDKIAGIKEAAGKVKQLVSKIATKINQLWEEHVGPLIQRAKKLLAKLDAWWEDTKGKIKAKFDAAMKVARKVLAKLKTTIVDPILKAAEKAKATVTSLYEGAKAKLGSWWSKLPGWAKAGIVGMVALATGPIGIAIAAALGAGHLLVKHKDAIITWAKGKLDAILPTIAKAYNFVKKQVSDGLAKLRAWGAKAKAWARAKMQAAYRAIDAATGGRLSKFRAALASMKSKITGTVCTALGEVSGPCINQFVPDPGENAKEGESADVTMTSNAEIVVPVKAVRVKVGRGSSVQLTRRGKKYQVTVTGSGLIAVMTPSAGGGGGSSAEVDVTLPGTAGDAWKSLTGKSGPSTKIEDKPATPAGGTGAPPTTGQATGGTGGAPPGGGAPTSSSASSGAQTDVSAEAGYKGSVAMTFDFDASEGKDSTCDGLGGLSAFLAAQGLGHTLPAPFGNLITGGAESAYAENVSSCVFTLAEYGQASVDVKKDGVGGLNAAIKGEASVSLEQKKDEAGNWTDTATLTVSLGLDGAAELALKGGDAINMKLAAGVSGSLFAKLSYSQKDDKISALSAGASAKGTVALSKPAIAGLLPPAIMSQIESALGPYLAGAVNGTLAVTATISVDNLHDLIGKLDSYFENPTAVNTDGVMQIVRSHLENPANVTKSVTVTVTTTKTLAGAKVTAGGGGVSGTGGVSIEENQTKVLYP